MEIKQDVIDLFKEIKQSDIYDKDHFNLHDITERYLRKERNNVPFRIADVVIKHTVHYYVNNGYLLKFNSDNENYTYVLTSKGREAFEIGGIDVYERKNLQDRKERKRREQREDASLRVAKRANWIAGVGCIVAFVAVLVTILIWQLDKSKVDNLQIEVQELKDLDKKVKELEKKINEKTTTIITTDSL